MGEMADVVDDGRGEGEEPEGIEGAEEPGGSGASDAVKEELARLAVLDAVWMKRVKDGEVVATEQVLAIQRQRAALLGIPLGAPRGVSVMTTRGGMGRGGGGTGAVGVPSGPAEVRVVVEFVDDWRNA